MEMTRQEAIENIIIVWEGHDQEFCCSSEESNRSHQEMIDSLRALGCTDDELGEQIEKPHSIRSPLDPVWPIL